MNIRIRNYAIGLMELVTQEELVDDCFRDLRAINDALDADEQLADYIASETHSSSDKKKRLQETFNYELDESVLQALFLVIDEIPRSRMEAELIHEFLTYYYQTRGIAFGAAYSAKNTSKVRLPHLRASLCVI